MLIVNGRAVRHDGAGAARRRVRAASTVAVVGLAAWMAWLIGGLGALLAVAALGLALPLALHRRRLLAPCSVAVVAVWGAVSFTAYVAHDNGETLTTRAATWARDHGMSPVVDRLEAWAYSDPPSVAPAGRLQLEAPTGPAATTTSTTEPAVTTSSTSPAATTSFPSSTSAVTSAPPTTAPVTGPPAALRPVFDPPLDAEGVWRVVARAGGSDAMWATGIRPLPAAGGAVATVVAIDQTNLRAGLFNGSELPGGTWRRGNRVPAELRPALLAAMNGGFRFDHIKGGYVTEGTVVRPLHDGDATLAIDRGGRVTIGQYGRDLTDDGTWVSLRQNLRLMVDDGRSLVRDGIAKGVWWGADFGSEVYTVRSGACLLANGMLAYVLASPVDAEQFAQVMIAVGCRRGMQLDINGTWPAFDVYAHDGGTITPSRVDRRMSPNVWRYLDGSSKEFVAFFDAALVPDPSVLDG